MKTTILLAFVVTTALPLTACKRDHEQDEPASTAETTPAAARPASVATKSSTTSMGPSKFDVGGIVPTEPPASE